MTDQKVKEIIEGARKMAKSPRGDKPTVAQILIELTLDSGVELYSDQKNDQFITVPEFPLVGYPIKSAFFRKWLAGKYYAEHQKGFSGENFLQVVAALQGKTIFEEVKFQLFNRIAKVGDTIFYDRGDGKEAFEITSKGWKLVTEAPIKFRRFTHQQEQIYPEKGGSLKLLEKYLNLQDEKDILLAQTYLIAVMIPDIPRAVLIAVGPQGSAKSSALKVFRTLIDPSHTELLSPKSDTNELGQLAEHHYLLYFDNLSDLRDETSDTYSRIVTGVGFSKRELYSDDQDILFRVLGAVGFSGINQVATKPDLLDRSLILSFEQIPPNKRIAEKKFWHDFEASKPLILGALFDGLSEALAGVSVVKLANKPRMADYVEYCVAATVALGKTPQAFLNAFDKNIKHQNEAAIESSSTAQAVLLFMEKLESEQKVTSWSGASSELHKKLLDLIEDNNLEVGGSYGFPRSSNWLWKKIVQVKPNLQALGIEANREREKSNNTITLSKMLQKDENGSKMLPLPPHASTKNDPSQTQNGSNGSNGGKNATFRHTNEETIKYADKDNNFLVAESIRLRQKLAKATNGEKPQIESDLEELIAEGQRREMVYFLNESQRVELIGEIFSEEERENEV